MKITIVIPMAGEGRRFTEAGYKSPKPFISVGDKPMIEWVLENLSLEGSRFYLIAQKSHIDAEPSAVSSLKRACAVEFVPITGKTEGAACTVLCAKEYISNDLPLLLANSDQIVDFDISKMIDDAKARNLDGSILVFREPGRDPKWSYAKLDSSGFVTETREKDPISEYATVGIYYFRSGIDFVKGAEKMIAENNRSKGEFYVCPVYNYLIQSGKKIGTYTIESSSMHGLGTPEDLEAYCRLMNIKPQLS